MKAPLSNNIKTIFEKNIYDFFDMRTIWLPERLREDGYDIEVKFADVKLKYFMNNEDVTEEIERGIEEGLGYDEETINRRLALREKRIQEIQSKNPKETKSWLGL